MEKDLNRKNSSTNLMPKPRYSVGGMSGYNWTVGYSELLCSHSIRGNYPLSDLLESK